MRKIDDSVFIKQFGDYDTFISWLDGLEQSLEGSLEKEEVAKITFFQTPAARALEVGLNKLEQGKSFEEDELAQL